MNSGGAPGQGQSQSQGQGQPGGVGAQQQTKRPAPTLFRPEQMRSLPEQFSASDKEKWEQGLGQLWSQLENNAPDTQQHQEAKRKLYEFSRTLTQKVQSYRQQQLQQAMMQEGQQAAGRPSGQGQPSGAQGSESHPANPNLNPQQKQQQQQSSTKPKVSGRIMEHVSTFPYVLPPNLAQGTPEATKYLHEVKSRYLKGLVTMDSATTRISHLEALVKKRNEDGKPLNAEEANDFKEKKEMAQKQHSEAKAWVDKFRSQQQQQQQQQQQRLAAGQQGSPGSSGGGVTSAGQPAPTRPQLNPQQPATNPVAPNTQAVAAAMEAARSQQMGGGRALMQQNGQPRGPNQVAPQQNIPSQQGGQAQIKTEAHAPAPINTAIASMQRGSVGNNSPHSGVMQSAGPPQSAPRALNQQQALQTAARTYSSGQTSGTPNVMGHSHTHPSLPRETPLATSKMPIPKNLPERAIAPPQPVQMSQARPTFTGGPSNAGSGAMSQPVLQKVPAYNMESDGDRVLSKKKLDELVRQVTGGGEGLGSGEGLTPEVEESILDVADNFVDQVLQAACKNAKERGSKILEIRDIQLTLERGYNIRIPGYASDEIRTVRKIQPSPAWISKMSAVQAAKVTGGKNTD